jgi:hypothetical protein
MQRYDWGSLWFSAGTSILGEAGRTLAVEMSLRLK